MLTLSSIQRYLTQCLVPRSILRAPERQVCSTRSSLVLRWYRTTLFHHHQISTKGQSNSTNLSHHSKHPNKSRKKQQINLKMVKYQVKATVELKFAQYHNSILIQPSLLKELSKSKRSYKIQQKSKNEMK